MVSESTPSLPSRLGSTRPALPFDGVDDDLQPGLGDPGGVDVPQQRPGVRVEDAGREVQVADLAGERPPVLLPREHPVQLALAGLRRGRRRARRRT